MEQIKIRVTGTSPLMMHADTFANPLNPAAQAHKELTAKRKKTNEDHVAIARSEFIGGAYWNKEDGFFVPGQNFDATFLAGAKLQKLGTHWKRGALVLENRVLLQSVRGEGYRWCPPAEQTQAATKDFERDASRAFRLAGQRLRNVRINELSDEQRRANTDAMAKVSQLRGTVRKQLR